MIDLNRKLPIGIQTFEKIRKGNYLYVDKTALVGKMVSTSIPYFLSRPRRFGKSLLISTFEAHFAINFMLHCLCSQSHWFSPTFRLLLLISFIHVFTSLVIFIS